MPQIQGQGIGSIKISGRKLKDLAISLRVFNSAGTGSVAVMPILRNIQVKVTLNRGGVIKIYDDNLLNLVLYSLWKAGLEPAVNVSYLLQVSAGQALMPLAVILDGPIDLQGDDVLDVSVNVLAGTYPTGLNAAACTLDFEFRDSLGREEAIPFINTRFIPSGAGTHQESLGSGVKNVMLANLDLGLGTTAAYTDAQQVFLNCQLISEHFTLNETGDRLRNRSYIQFETPAQAILRGQVHLLTPAAAHKLMDDVQLSLTMNASLVAAAQNVIIWGGFMFHGETTVRAVHDDEQHKAKQVNKLQSKIGVTAMSHARHAAMHGRRP